MRRLPHLLLLLSLALAGCKTQPTKFEVKGDSPVTLRSDAKRTEHTAKLGTRVLISLPANELATHRWQIASHDVRFLQQLTDFTLPTTPEGRPTIAFAAIRPGSTRVRFVLVPANGARESTPIDAHDLVLKIE